MLMVFITICRALRREKMEMGRITVKLPAFVSSFNSNFIWYKVLRDVNIKHVCLNITNVYHDLLHNTHYHREHNNVSHISRPLESSLFIFLVSNSVQYQWVVELRMLLAEAGPEVGVAADWSQDGAPAQPGHDVLAPPPVVPPRLEPARGPGRVLRLQPLLHVDLDVTGQREERLLHVDARLGRGLHELDPVLYRQLFTSLFGNLYWKKISFTVTL